MSDIFDGVMFHLSNLEEDLQCLRAEVEALRAGIASEREACAKVCEACAKACEDARLQVSGWYLLNDVAAAIRSRGAQEGGE
jgi:hypothetical protein